MGSVNVIERRSQHENSSSKCSVLVKSQMIDFSQKAFPNEDDPGALIESALKNYRYSLAVRELLKKDCLSAGIISVDGTVNTTQISKCTSAQKAWYDKYRTLSDLIHSLDTAYSIMENVYKQPSSPERDHIMCDCFYLSYFAPVPKHPTQIIEDLDKRGSKISLATYYRNIRRGRRVFLDIIAGSDLSRSLSMLIEQSGEIPL